MIVGSDEEGPMHENRPDRLKIIPLADERIELGGILHKKCKVVPKSRDWVVSWILPDGTRSSKSKLRDIDIQQEDLGIYTCKATNRVTGATKSKAIKLMWDGEN